MEEDKSAAKSPAVSAADDGATTNARAVAAQKHAERVEKAVKEAENLAKSGHLADALNMLYAEEKTCRVAEEAANTATAAVMIVQLCWDAKDVQAVIDNVVLIARKRGQLATVTSAVVDRAMSFLDALAQSDPAQHEKLVKGLRNVTEGKIFLEVPRAKLTRTLAELLEKRGDKAEACRVMQEVQVETFGALEDGEKTDFILEEVRLCLETGETSKALVLGKKVSQKLLAKEEHMHRRLRYCELMVQYWTVQRDWLEVAKKYDMAYNTPCVLADRSRYTPLLTSVILHTILAPHSSEQHDLVQRLLADRHTEELPEWRGLLARFDRPELIRWDADVTAPHAAALAAIEPFRSACTIPAGAPVPEPGKPAPAAKDVWVALRQRVIEHNIRVVARFYSRITTARLAQLLQLSVAEAEIAVAAQVNAAADTARAKTSAVAGTLGASAAPDEASTVYARIDRPAGVVRFGRPKDAAVMLDDWDSQVVDLVTLIDDTCHLIHRENIAHHIASSAAPAEAAATAMH